MFSCHTSSRLLRQPLRKTSSKSVQTQISVSLGTKSKDKFLAISNLKGLIFLLLTVTPKSFNNFTVLSVLPVSRTMISSASFIDSTHLLTCFSSFILMA